MSFTNRNLKNIVKLIVLIFCINILITPTTISINDPMSTSILTPLASTESPIAIKYISGDWIVNTSEFSTNEELVLNGNLIIKNGGVLTLQNTILRMNCSKFYYYWIIVESGGQLKVWDLDNNPLTSDGSLITDSAYDTDDGGNTDYRYYFKVDVNGLLEIRNSAIEECGKYDSSKNMNTYGLFIAGDNAIIRNSSFIKCERGIILNGAKNTRIEYVNISDVTNAIDIYKSDKTLIKNCWVNSTGIENGINIRNSNGVVISNNIVSASNYAYCFEYVNSSKLIDNQGSRSSNSSTIRTVDIHLCNNLNINGFVVNGYRRIFEFQQCENISVKRLNVQQKTVMLENDWALRIEQCKNMTFEQSIFKNINGSGLDMYDCQDIVIANCTYNMIHQYGILGDGVNRLKIEYCNFTNTSISKLSFPSYKGIYIKNSEDCVITKCRINYSRSTEIEIYNCKNISIVNNWLGGKVGGGGETATEEGVTYEKVKNSLIAHNQFFYHLFYGIYLINSDNNLIQNNTFNGYNKDGDGIFLSDSFSNVISKAIITNYHRGIYDNSGNIICNVNVSSCDYRGMQVYGSILENVTFYDITSSRGLDTRGPPVLAKNSTFRAATDAIYIFEDGQNVTIINCKLEPNSIQFRRLNQRLFRKWWVDIYVEDSKGAVPGALVHVYNRNDDEEVNGTTDNNGHVLLPVTEEVLFDGGVFLDSNPHNITAEMGSAIGNVTPKPTIISNDNYTIILPGDTKPTQPTNLIARSSSDDVLLTWEYPNLTDLDHFDIFHSSDPNNFDFNTPIGTANNLTRSYLDLGNASDWETYFYCVQANDSAGQASESSNIVMCGDWVVANGVSNDFSGLDIIMNGSLIIESGGYLNLSNIKLRVNATVPGEFGILVKGNGILKIIDNSNVSANNFSNSIYFIVEPLGQLYMNNSISYGVGYNAPNRVNHTGIYIAGDHSELNWNTIHATSETDKGVILNKASFVRLIGNSFNGLNNYAIHMIHASDCLIDNNTIDNPGEDGIRLEYTNNNEISYNSITNCHSGLILDHAIDDKILSNPIDRNIIGLHARYSDGILIYDNTFTNHSTQQGVYIYYTNNCTFSKNQISYNKQGLRAIWSHYLAASSNQFVDHDINGMYLTGCSHGTFIDNTVSDSNLNGVKFDSKSSFTNMNMTIIGGNISDCSYGLIISKGYSINIEYLELWHNYCGFYLQDAGNVNLNAVSFKDNTGYGVQVEGIASAYSYSLKLENTTHSNTNCVELWLDDGANVFLVNVTIPYSKLQFQDKISKVAFFWYAHVYVEDMFGNPSALATVTMERIDGGTTIGFTDAFGYLKWQLLHDKTVLKDGNFTSNPYTITAVNGNHTGVNITVIEKPLIIIVRLENEQPQVLDIELTPQLPTTTDKLVLTFNYSDPENDPQFPHLIKWFVDGAEDISLRDTLEVPATKTAKGQNWFARVMVYDGVAYSVAVDSDIVKIINTAPVVSNIIISPPAPSSLTDIHINYNFSDADNDSEGDTRIKWYMDNGSGYVETFFTGSQLLNTNTHKGEKWMAKVIPHDGEDYGLSVDSTNEITIGNSPPEITNVSFKSDRFKSTENVTFDYTYFDIDTDSESGTVFEWFVSKNNGETFSSSEITTKDLIADATVKGDMWYCRITPNDGEAVGLAVNTANVLITNSPPMVYNINLTYPGSSQQSSPRPFDSISIEYNYFDPDSDAEAGTTFNWEIFESGAWTSLSRDKTLNPVFTSKGDVIRCKLIPSDGEDDGLEMVSGTITIGNSPPTITELLIETESGLGGQKSDLKLNYTYFDPDGDTEGAAKIKWFLNNLHKPEFNNLLIIPAANIAKGETWVVEVTPYDGEEYGSPKNSSPFSAPNTQPKIINFTILPDVPSALTGLNFDYTFFDADNDVITDLEVVWYKEADRVELLDDESNVDGTYLKKGEIWICELRIFDGEDWSDWLKAEPVLIANAPPEISAEPSPGQLQIKELDMQVFSVIGTDVDDDPLLYYWYFDDKIESLKNTYTLLTDYDSAGFHKLNLSVFDGESWATVSWDVMVENENRRPTMDVKAPKSRDLEMNELETVEFVIGTEDPDEDNLIIQWYLDSMEVGTGEEEYIYQPDLTSSGTHQISVVVKDEGPNSLSTTASWNVTVKDVVAKDNMDLGPLGLSWDVWGILMEILVVIFSAIFAIIGILRVRKKSRKLKEYMHQIEQIKDKKIAPNKTEIELNSLKKQIKDEFSKGLVSENHYIILEREIDSALGETRRAIVEGEIAPPAKIKADIAKALDDGIITETEYETVLNKIMRSKKLTTAKKDKLKKQMKRWMEEDVDVEGAVVEFDEDTAEELVMEEPVDENLNETMEEPVDDDIDDIAEKPVDEDEDIEDET